MTNSIASVIIAGGYSSRMLAFKPLLDLGGVSVIEKVIETHRAAGVKKIIVVVGYNGEAIKEHLKGRDDVQCVENPDYARGMYTSIQTGIATLDETTEAFFMHPADIPLVRSETIKALVRAYSERRRGIVYPTFDGKRGHPPLIDFTYRSEILCDSGEGGLKRVLEQFEKEAHDIICLDEGIALDMDTPEDYERLKLYALSDAPGEHACQVIAAHYAVPEKVIGHCEAVSDIAISIGLHVNAVFTDAPLNLGLLYAAGRLHDVARVHKAHAHVGASWMRDIGYGRLGDVIEHHMDMDCLEKELLTESEVLYLADKLVQESDYCGIEMRFEPMRERYANEPEILEQIKRRYDTAKCIQNKVESIIGREACYGQNGLFNPTR